MNGVFARQAAAKYYYSQTLSTNRSAPLMTALITMQEPLYLQANEYALVRHYYCVNFTVIWLYHKSAVSCNFVGQSSINFIVWAYCSLISIYNNKFENFYLWFSVQLNSTFLLARISKHIEFYTCRHKTRNKHNWTTGVTNYAIIVKRSKLAFCAWWGAGV